MEAKITVVTKNDKMIANILFVEDDKIIRDNYTEFLKRAGFAVTEAVDQESALKLFNTEDYDLVLLDIALGSDTEAGFKVCNIIRGLSETMPVIFLTSLNSDIDKISGMRLGADDYITKDVSFEYLVVRIKTLLHRIQILTKSVEASNDLIYDNLVLNVDKLTAFWKKKRLDLSLTHIWLVHALICNQGRVCTVQQLMSAAKITVQPNTISVHINHIRQTFLSADPDFSAIKSERGMGYRWVQDNK